MGFLVMDEMFDCWTVAKKPFDYHLVFNDWSITDTRDTVQRDRNHPCIILYSAGNEIHDTPNAALAKRILTGLVQTFHENDPTRPVTQALFRPNVSHDYDNGLADLLDVVGQNYRENEILAAHAQKPTRSIVGTENRRDLATWLPLRDNPQYAGQFLWTGIDYLGEARRWPTIASNSGLFDRVGFARPEAFERASWWSDKPVLCIARRIGNAPRPTTDPGYGPGEGQTAPAAQATAPATPRGRGGPAIPAMRPRQLVFSDWTPANAAAHDESIEVYSNCQQVELILNGQSLGTKPRNADDSPRTWKVPFAAGTLKAIGSNNGQVAATQELTTASKPAKVMLSVDRPKLADDWDDVAYVTATIADDAGTRDPRATDDITFHITGPGTILAVDNGDRETHEPFQSNHTHAAGGECVAIIRAIAGSGDIHITADAAGLVGGSADITTMPAQTGAAR
jgi:beta-galactosidase